MASVEEQIKDIEEEIKKTQYNKATQHHIGLLKAKIARLREKRESGGRGKKGSGYAVRKTGDATVVLVGFPSVGKSTLLNKLTNAESRVGAYAFTTLTVVPGVMEYNHAKVQVLDVPGLIKGAATGSGKGREIIAVIRSSDLIIFVLDPFSLNHYDALRKELNDAGIRVDQRPPDVKITRRERGGLDITSTCKLTKMSRETIIGVLQEFSINNAAVVIRDDITSDELVDVILKNRTYISSMVVINKADMATKQQLQSAKKQFPKALVISAEKDDVTSVKESIFKHLNLIRIYLKEVGKKPDMDVPLIVRSESSVSDVCNRLHKDFVSKFKFAKVWGSSAKFDGQVLHGTHVLKDRDVLEIHLR